MAPKRSFSLFVAFAMAMAAGACATGEIPTPEEIKQENTESRARQLIRVGDASRTGGDAASALGFYKRAQSKRPDWDVPYRRIGETALVLGLMADAAQAYTQLTELAPNDVDGLLGLGRALVALDKPDQAADAFARAQAAAPKDHRPLNGLGVARDLLGDHGAAQESYRRGLTLNANSRSLANNYGLSLALSGQFGEAIRVLGNAAKSPDAGPRTRQNLALVYGLSGDMDRAAQLGRLDLSEAEVQNNLKRYEALRKLGDKARARAVHSGNSTDN